MPNKIIDIDSEFEDVQDFFDETNILKRTSAIDRYQTDWKNQWLKKQKEKNIKIYGNQTYVLRSPGNDLLDFYDKQNNLLGKDNRARSAIPPSLVHYYRFKHDYPKELFDKSKNYGIHAYLRDQLKSYYRAKDNTYWGQVLKTRYDWMVDTPHLEYRFNLQSDLEKFVCEKFDQKCFSKKIHHNTNTGILIEECLETMFWRGKLKGWSMVIEK